MKKTDYSNVALGQEISGTTLVHEQNALIESLKAITRALGVDANKVTVLFGCVMTKAGNQYDQSAGAVAYMDEIYFVDAFSGNHATNIPVYQFYNVNVGPAVRFADLQYRNVHIDHKMRLVMASSGSGEEDYNAVEYLKDKIYSLIGVQVAIQNYTDNAIANLVASSPAALDTLNELAAALGDDPNFAATVNAAIAAKVSISSIVNSLTSTATNVPLSAAQGKVLNDVKLPKSDVVNNLTTTSTTKALSAAQGKILNENKASKSQGSWTDINLINGWTNIIGHTAQYRVNQFGKVELRGRIVCSGATAPGFTSSLPATPGNTYGISRTVTVYDVLASQGTPGTIFNVVGTGSFGFGLYSSKHSISLDEVSYYTDPY